MPAVRRRTRLPHFVIVTAVLVLAVGACRDAKSTHSEEPPPALPGWHDVDAPGTPDRPTPTLVVNRDGSICSKGFYASIARPSGDVFELRHGYRVFPARWRDELEQVGVPIRCPEGIAAAVAAVNAHALLWRDVPVLRPRPQLLRVDVATRAERGLVLRARLLVATVTQSDSVGLEFTSGSGAEPFAWREKLDKLRVTIKGPTGKIRTFLAARATPHKTRLRTLPYRRRHVIMFGDEGPSDHEMAVSTRWEGTPGPLFPGPGRYAIKVAGALEMDSGALAFDTDEFNVMVIDVASHLSLADLEAKAAAYVISKHPQVPDLPRKTLPTIEDEKGNRVVRFALSAKRHNDDIFVEVVMSAKGEVLSMVDETVFRCVAAGTTISTPMGPRLVETLRRGDELIGFDTTKGEATTVRVMGIWESYATELFSIGSDLVVSGRHPVYADGAWVEARHLDPGAALWAVNGQSVTVTSRPRAGGATVYDLSVSWPHTYFAGALLVHNKSRQSDGATRMRTDLDARPKGP